MNRIPASLRRLLIPTLLHAAALAAVAQQYDFGDLPIVYGTQLPSGARHLVVPGFSLGELTDAEANGGPGILANADDVGGTDDEDGMVPLHLPDKGIIAWQRGSWTQLIVDVKLPALLDEAGLDAWAAWDAGGGFSDSGEFPCQRIGAWRLGWAWKTSLERFRAGDCSRCGAGAGAAQCRRRGFAGWRWRPRRGGGLCHHHRRAVASHGRGGASARWPGLDHVGLRCGGSAADI